MQLLNQIRDLDFPANLPKTLLTIQQTFDRRQVEDVAAATRQALQQSGFLTRVQPGQSVAIGVGSRGITHLATIVKTTVDYLHELKSLPFIFPSMGSHAGATAEGQRQMLINLGVDPAVVGAEIRATMEIVRIGQVPAGPELYQDALAAQADHTLLINRIKPHTSFRSHIESGLAKMCAIGMGKQPGAALFHSLGVEGLRHFLAPAARIYEANTNLIGGLAILENAYHQTAEIVGLSPAEIGADREAELLIKARGLMASLPFAAIDVLVVKQLGKNISGTGLDTNVINRLKIPRQPEPADAPDIAVIAVLDLTEETHGNANGLGLANVTTARVAAKIDFEAMYTNAISSGILGMWRAHLPLTMADDRRALQVALRGCAQPPEAARMVFIQDTLSLDEFYVSPSLRPAVEAQPRLSITGEIGLSFDQKGAMMTPWRFSS